MNDLRAFLPAWQEMELASPSQEKPVTQIEADVPIEPLALQADATNLDLELHVYERPLAVTPFGAPEDVPDWQSRCILENGGCHALMQEKGSVGTFSGAQHGSVAATLPRAALHWATKLETT